MGVAPCEGLLGHLLWVRAADKPGNPLLSSALMRSASMSEDYLEFQGRPGHIEKRFPVDRKKLEKLITGMASALLHC